MIQPMKKEVTTKNICNTNYENDATIYHADKHNTNI